jgi:hypothetical protein
LFTPTHTNERSAATPPPPPIAGRWETLEACFAAYGCKITTRADGLKYRCADAPGTCPLPFPGFGVGAGPRWINQLPEGARPHFTRIYEKQQKQTWPWSVWFPINK